MATVTEIMELVFKATNQAVLDQLNAQYKANAVAVDSLNQELEDALVTETQFRVASGRLHDEKRRLEQQIDAVTRAMREEAAAATRLKVELGDQGVAGAAAKSGVSMAGFAQAMMQVGVLYDDIQYGSKNVANNLFALGMAIPEPRIRLFMTALGFLTAAFHKQIDAGLAWAGILDENVAKGLDKSKESTDKLKDSVAGLEEKLKAAGEASRELDDAEKERRENLAKAMAAPSQAQSNDATQAKGILDTMGGPRFEGFIKELLAKNLPATLDPKSPFGQGEIARQTNAMQAGIVGGDAAQSRALLDMMSRNPALLAKWNVSMPAPMAAGFGAGEKTDAQIAKEADEKRGEEIRAQLKREEEEKKKRDEKKKKDDDKADAEAAQAEQDRLGDLYGGFGSGKGGVEEAARNRLASGQSPDEVGAALSGQLMQAGQSGPDAFMLAMEAIKQAQQQLDEQRAQGIVGLAEQLRQSQEEADRELQQLLEGVVGMGAGNRRAWMGQMQQQMQQMKGNDDPWYNNRSNGL
jgi:hypothetical protein